MQKHDSISWNCGGDYCNTSDCSKAIQLTQLREYVEAISLYHKQFVFCGWPHAFHLK
jgi:hypothetical protein